VRLLFLILFIATLLTYLGIRWSQKPRESEWWRGEFPEETIDTPYFTIAKKAGWIGGLSESFKEEERPLLLQLHVYLDVLQNDSENYQEAANIFLLFNRHNTEEDWLSFKHSKIIFDIDVQKIKDEHSRELYKYEGPLRILLNDKGELIYKETDKRNVYIALQEYPGLWAVFWGFQEYENDFWDMIDSIKWK
jgi:hypothetical protein